MTSEEIKQLATTVGLLSESECDYLAGRQSKVSFPYATDIPSIAAQIEGMTSEEVDEFVEYLKPMGAGNGKRKVRKN